MLEPMPTVAKSEPRKRRLRGRPVTCPWTAEERTIARHLLNDGVDAWTVARGLGRTHKDVVETFPELSAEAGKSKDAASGTYVFSEREIRTAATMRAYGIPKSTIATALGVSTSALDRGCGTAMEMAVMRMNAHAARLLFMQMLGGDTRAIMFWLKTRGGSEWRETQHLQIDAGAGVLVAPGGIEPTKWIEMEEMRTQEAPDEAPVVEHARAEVLEVYSKPEALLPWESAGDGDEHLAGADDPLPEIDDLPAVHASFEYDDAIEQLIGAGGAEDDDLERLLYGSEAETVR